MNARTITIRDVAAHDMGLTVPQFVSVVGFDDMPVSAYVRPALTTVHQPIQEMGRGARAAFTDGDQRHYLG